MKKLSYLTFLALLSSTLFTACFIDDDDHRLFGCVDGDGPVESVEVGIPDFDEIILDMGAVVFLTQGDEQSVVIEGKPNIIDEIERDVHNGVWRIETDDCVRDVGELTFFITVPDLKAFKIAGSGEVFTENMFVLDDVELEISGSGEMDLAFQADDVNLKISGSGKMVIEGQADEVDIVITGSGDIRAFDFPVRESDIKISGSGDAEVQVDEMLRIRISGSGDVYYKGYPELDVSVSGSGDVIDAN